MNPTSSISHVARIALLLSAVAASPAWATNPQGGHRAQGGQGGQGGQGQQLAQSSPATVAGDMTDGEVRRVDKEGGRLTLKHADIKSLDMPAMTMVFQVKDKAMLEKLKAGDKIKFRAVNDAGKFTLVEIQMAQ